MDGLQNPSCKVARAHLAAAVIIFVVSPGTEWNPRATMVQRVRAAMVRKRHAVSNRVLGCGCVESHVCERKWRQQARLVRESAQGDVMIA